MFPIARHVRPGWVPVKDIDELDQQILRMMLEDASVSYETIAKEASTSVGTVHNRIKRMREDGIIARTVAHLDSQRLGFDICALIGSRIEGGHMEEVQQDFCDHPNVCSIYDITGEYDTMFVAKFPNTEELNRFVKELAQHEYVNRTSTNLVLNIVKESLTPRI
jgi:Lrp/AsnC family transcriptional regulator for asnA, asnC and gidA